MTLQRHSCATCAREVLVEKFSEAHTSIQWLGDSSGCPGLAAGAPLGDSSRGCGALRASIDRAAAQGEIEVSHVELPTADQLPRLH